MLRLSLFGGFSLMSGDGPPIEIDLAKSRALLSYLAINSGRTVNRSLLASLLWGSQPENRARHSLTQALSILARALGPEAPALHRSRDYVCLQDGHVDVDLNRFHKLDDASDPSSLVEAVDLFEPNVLGEFSFSEVGFDEWALMTRENSQEHVLRVGMAYLALDESVQHSDDFTRIARKLLQVDPFFEPGHRALIRKHLARGDIGAARRQAEACRSTLREELGVEPGPETQRLMAETYDTPQLAAPKATLAAKPRDEIVKPSIVVLAMENLTEDPSLQHVCQGLSDDITTELVRYRSLFVISRESAFQLRSEPENIGPLCRRLGVRHALCGSLRPYRGQLRINVRLLEGVTGQTIWSERYDADKASILEISDDVTENLVARLVSSLEEDALARARRRPVAQWSAYDHLLQGLVYHHKSWYGTGMLLGAVKHFTRAVELDSGLARAHAYLACAISAPWYKDREDASLDRSLKHANLAVDIDPFEAEAQRVLGGIHLVHGDHELAHHHFDLALREHPGNAHVLAHAAKYHAYTGANADAVSLVNRARQLNPLHPAWYWQHLGVAKFGQEDDHQAIRMFSRLPFLVFFDRLYLAASHARLGEREAASHHLSIALEQKPELTRDNVGKFFPYKSDSDLRSVIDGLSFAGLQ
jgi:TolB-like protein/two-component SAPR family response regulator